MGFSIWFLPLIFGISFIYYKINLRKKTKFIGLALISIVLAYVYPIFFIFSLAGIVLIFEEALLKKQFSYFLLLSFFIIGVMGAANGIRLFMVSVMPLCISIAYFVSYPFFQMLDDFALEDGDEKSK